MVIGNDPAFKLYKEMGFEEFTKSYEYHFKKDSPIPAPSPPDGYRLKSLSPYDWKTRFNFAQRVTPAHITRFEPVTEERYRISWIMPLFGKLFESAGGFHSDRFAAYGPTDEVVAIGQYSYRKREGGTNSTKVSIDPNNPELAEVILRHVFSEIQNARPGRRIENSFEDWQSALIQCAEELGCEKRFGAHRMGLRF